MVRFLLTRASLVIPTFLGIVFLAFILIRLVPGDPVEVRVGERGIAPERHAQLLHEMGLDRPLYVQFFDYVGGVLHGDLGISIITHRPVLDEFLTLFPATLELSFFAMLLALSFGLPAGVIAAVKRGSIFDHAIMGASLTGYSMPIFWWGLLLILTFSVNLGWTPVSGRIGNDFFFEGTSGFMIYDAIMSDEEGAVTSALSHLILPTIVLGTIPLAVIARMTRSAMLEVLGEDYIRTARAKGLSTWRVVGVHALRNALIPVVTVIGLQVGVLMAGAVLTETTFSWPGIGKWLVESINRRDYPALQGGVLLIASLVMAINLAVDLLYGLLNPRIRHKR
ncbi:ABC transporter permease subunit [Dongia sp.]|jgi:dipeptide transport system permease protein|uniref:ABC transporter permease subunit n=1 Tax=Dongia sp. TaxID=1977262 RepID=UPI0035B219DB